LLFSLEANDQRTSGSDSVIVAE